MNVPKVPNSASSTFLAQSVSVWDPPSHGYATVAIGDCCDPPDPIAILLVGIGGSGKTTAAVHLGHALNKCGYRVQVIHFDALRKVLVPAGVDAFSAERSVKQLIYDAAKQDFNERLAMGYSLVIDSGLSVESIRIELKRKIPALRIVNVQCWFPVAVLRDTKRSLYGPVHERGRFLHLRALRDKLNPFKHQKFPQPGVTYPFEHPDCADLHVRAFLRRPSKVADAILEGLSEPIRLPP